MGALPLGFATPMILGALVLLPVLYWLLRLTPPPPRRVPLPTLALVRDLERRDETPAHTPWWLLLLRLLIAALVILAMAGPIWNPRGDAASGSGPLLVFVDNGWSAASTWRDRAMRAEELVTGASAGGRPVALRASADDPVDIVPGTAQRAAEQLRGLAPQPHTPSRAAHLAAIQSFIDRFPTGEVVWIADGTNVGDQDGFTAEFAAKAGRRLTVLASPVPPAVALAGASNGSDALVVKVLRASADGRTDGTLRALDSRGRPLGETSYRFPAGAPETEARFDIPLELRNEIVRIETPEEPSAGGVALLDGRNKRRRVGVISGESTDTAQPLVSPAYFVTRALAPFAEVREVPRGTQDPYGRLIDDGAGALILTDVGTLTGEALQKLKTFVDGGGVLIRFAGRRAAAPVDELMPVRLRRSERVLGGALSWETPKKLASFAAGGPFDGLAVPGDVTVSQQILAEPDVGLSVKTWAALEDGTPLITGEKRGRGTIALFHVTADTAWSTLPLSGAFVETLRRIVILAQGAEERADAGPVETAAPLRTLDGNGTFRAPPATAQPLPRGNDRPATPTHPPGFYGTPEATVAVNTLAANARLTPIDFAAAGLAAGPLVALPPIDLRPYMLAMALLLFLADAVAAMLLSGALAGGLRSLGGRLRPAAGGAGAVLLAVAVLAAAGNQALAKDDRLPPFRADDIEAALTTRLAFVITGDREVDETSRLGLSGLGRVLSTRTALEPGEPIGVDLTRDELVFYPLLYWPMAASRPVPPETAIRKIETFMKQGGTIVFDTRDALNSRPGSEATPETRMLRRILDGLDVPELEPVPKDHVVTKAFYIVEQFVGRYATGRTWIEILARSEEGEKGRPARAGDRVSPIIITSNDLAAAWAVERNGQPRYPLIPGDGRQREMSLRAGINIVMYALTGNYKADQVHIPALLERLGQ